MQRAYPVWDIRRSLYFLHYGPCQDKIGLMEMKLPEEGSMECGEFQYVEKQVMTKEDYGLLLSEGYRAYLFSYYKRIFNVSEPDVLAAEQLAMEVHLAEIESAKTCGQTFLYGAHLYFPGSHISNMRSFEEFIRDIYSDRGLVKKALAKATLQLIEDGIAITKKTGIKRAMLGANRVSSQFFSEEVFEDLFWPSIRECAETLIDCGITPIFHLDGDWIRNLKHFLTLPPKKSIIELDGGTDIFEAKGVLRGHTCLLGDVPATLFCMGTPGEMEAYCKRLMVEVGAEGGFILGSGCTLPYLAKDENVTAFFNSVPF